MEDDERSGAPKKFENDELGALLNENNAQTLKELAEQLNVDESTVFRRLHAMGKIQKEGRCCTPQIIKCYYILHFQPTTEK